jgi:hypothetical protein
MNTAAHTAHTLQGRATWRRPTAAPYWLLALLAVAGIAAAITWATFRTLDTIGRVDDFARCDSRHRGRALGRTRHAGRLLRR